ncbi:MAG: serpin family protein [Deltaproteobacteria bacterium]|jgi:serpin B|nr:serpin family protein [Deltaproteobacteria bacterium]
MKILFFCFMFLALFSLAPEQLALAADTAPEAAAQQAALIEPTEPSEISQKTAAWANDFAFRLARSLAAKAGNDNLVTSPFSVWLPLAALVGATDLDLRPSLTVIIGGPEASPETIDQSASRLIYSLTTPRGQKNNQEKSTLKIANAIFVSNNQGLKPEFAQRLNDFYLAQAITVDFKSPQAVKTVNDWIAEKTLNKITDLVSEFDSQTIAVLANAIYLSDSWLEPFNKQSTKKGAFHSPTGDREVDLMENNKEYSYFEDDALQAANLKLAGGGGLYVLLPKDGQATSLLSTLTAARLNEIDQGSNLTPGRLVLPRFKIQSPTFELSESLQKLGVTLFSPSLKPLTGGVVTDNSPLYISKALHKALVEVDELGLTAAAATVMGMTRTSLNMAPPFEMICDKPFVFVVYGRAYDNPVQVLFTGIVNQP